MRIVAANFPHLSVGVAKFSLQQIEKIAALAKLELSPAEKRQFAEQFDSILGYVAMIQEVEVPKDLEVEAPPLATLREDKAEPSGITPESFSPYLESGHFKVPKVIE